MEDPILHVVLVEPEIPPNTGNIARLCAASRVRLHLVEPLGFDLDDRQLKRAGMDYWRHVDWRRWPSWSALVAARSPGFTPWLVEEGGPLRHDQAGYQRGDWLVFGRETAGLPAELLRTHPDRWLRIPMSHPGTRSLNLSNCVAITVYEALRQLGFPEERPGAPPGAAPGHP